VAQELPLPVFGELDYPEETRLKYRFLDLRRERLHKNITLRSKVIQSIRRRMVAQGFTEFQTPILTASSPKARATSSCRRACIPGSSTRCRRRRSSSSS
jgi:aspartyl-tRNA synthetase